MQAAGYFHNIEFRPSEGYRNFNTWMGDPVRVLLLKAILQEIKDKHLVENVQITGNYLKDGLLELQARLSTRPSPSVQMMSNCLATEQISCGLQCARRGNLPGI